MIKLFMYISIFLSLSRIINDMLYIKPIQFRVSSVEVYRLAPNGLTMLISLYHAVFPNISMRASALTAETLTMREA